VQEKLTITHSKCVGEQNTLLTKNAVNDVYDATIFIIFGVQNRKTT